MNATNTIYRFVPINRVIFSDLLTNNLIVVNHENNNDFVCQPINCSDKKFITYMRERRQLKLRSKHKGVYVFQKVTKLSA